MTEEAAGGRFRNWLRTDWPLLGVWAVGQAVLIGIWWLTGWHWIALVGVILGSIGWGAAAWLVGTVQLENPRTVRDEIEEPR